MSQKQLTTREAVSEIERLEALEAAIDKRLEALEAAIDKRLKDLQGGSSEAQCQEEKHQ